MATELRRGGGESERCEQQVRLHEAGCLVPDFIVVLVVDGREEGRRCDRLH